jgi:hypothetical protein
VTLNLSGWQYVNPHNQKFQPAQENLPWFDVRPGEWYFECPQVGTLDGQPDTSPRSEMRERIGGQNAKWDIMDGPHQLDATLILDEVVERAVIGQIHASDDEPLKIHVLRDGRVYCTDDADPIERPFLHPTTGAQLYIPFGTQFAYRLRVPGGNEHVLRALIYLGGVTYKVEWPIATQWQNVEFCYFKAGLYCHTDDPSQYGSGEKYRARFANMVATH